MPMLTLHLSLEDAKHRQQELRSFAGHRQPASEPDLRRSGLRNAWSAIHERFGRRSERAPISPASVVPS